MTLNINYRQTYSRINFAPKCSLIARPPFWREKCLQIPTPIPLLTVKPSKFTYNIFICVTIFLFNRRYSGIILISLKLTFQLLIYWMFLAMFFSESIILFMDLFSENVCSSINCQRKINWHGWKNTAELYEGFCKINI